MACWDLPQIKLHNVDKWGQMLTHHGLANEMVKKFIV